MINKDKIQHHIDHLQEKHDTLDKKIITEENQYGNHLHIAELKKEKLRLKDEISQFKNKIGIDE
jgi:hypothetical protein